MGSLGMRLEKAHNSEHIGKKGLTILRKEQLCSVLLDAAKDIC